MEILKKTHKKSKFVYFKRGSDYEKEILGAYSNNDEAVLQITMEGNLYIAEIVPNSVLKEEAEKDREELKKLKELINNKIKFYEEHLKKIEAERRKRIENYGMKKESRTLNEEMDLFRYNSSGSYGALDALKRLLKGE